MPGLRPGALPFAPEDLISKTIPKDELAKLPQSLLQPPSDAAQALSGVGGSGDSSRGFLGQMVSDVSAKQSEAGAAMRGVIGGGDVQLHQAMIAVEEASISFQLMVEVRNRLLESYQELMRMQV